MKTFKKKDIHNFKPEEKVECVECETNEIDEEEQIDEFVTSTGGEISGDEKNVNNSEIKTAPQNTTDQFNSMAIQPNRYLYGVTGSAYSSGTRAGTMEGVDKLAKDKMIKLLEEIGTSNDMTDINNNNITDIKELRPNVASKLKILVDTVEKNNLRSGEVAIMLNHLIENLVPRLDDNDRRTLKDKF